MEQFIPSSALLVVWVLASTRVVSTNLVLLTKKIFTLLWNERILFTVGVISQNVTPFLYCKIHNCRVGVSPIWVGPTHSSLGQPTLYTSSLRHPKISYFQLVLLEIQQFESLRDQFCFILVLSGKLEKCNFLPFQNYSSKIAHLLVS